MKGSGMINIRNCNGLVMKAIVGLGIYNLVLLLLTTCGGAETYAATISLSVSDSITASAFLPNSGSGTFTSDTNTTNISVTTTNFTGYTLSLKSNSSSAPALTSTNGSIPSISQSTSTLDTAGTWGYKPTKKNGNTWNNLAVKHGNTTYTSGHYLPGPTTTEDILDVTDEANNDTANEYNLAIATKLDSTTKAGTYSNTFIVTAVANEVPTYTVTYTGTWEIKDVEQNSLEVSHDGLGTTGTFTYEGGTTVHLVSESLWARQWFYGNIYLNGVKVAGGGYNWAVNSDATIHSTGHANSGGVIYINSAPMATYNITLNNQSATAAGTGKIYEHYPYRFSTASSDSTTMTINTNPITIPTKSGYNFDGYYTGQNGTGTKYIDENGYLTSSADPSYFTAAGTLYANWELAPITFDQAFYAAGKSKQGNYYKMQDMTASICNSVTTPTTITEDISTQLIDTRDSKVYWVNKLKDGNCWMTQNLDYDIKASGNVVAKIGGTTTTWSSPQGATKTALSSSSTATHTYSWDPGDYYVANGGGFGACTTWRPTRDCESTKATVSLTSTDAKGNQNLHYHLGNYYQWNTATAGYGGTKTSQEITQSICPKGWRLPRADSYTVNYSFGKLTNAYGITNSATGSSDADLIKSPLWFVRAGSVNGGKLNNQGTYGLVWSSLAYVNMYNAYFLNFRLSYVYPSDNDLRYLGYSVRCVAE